jgi:hypothetical protein
MLAQQFLTGEQTVRIIGTEAAPVWLTFDKDYISGEFDFDVEENTDNKLVVKLHNKSNTDVLVEDGQIVKDTLLNIKSVEIDEIDLGSMIWTHSTYKPDHPQKFNGEIVTELKNCVNLGWNGSYVLSFTSPFYIWLLENI